MCWARRCKADRDHQFTYLGLQTLYDRYFIHSGDTRFELPQVFFMRVAMGLASRKPTGRAPRIEFYNLLSSFDYMASTPHLFNAGTLRPQLSSCYLTTVPDDLYGIYGAIRDNAMLSKWAGGLGNDWTPVRALGAYIKGTNGKSQGVVPFLKVVNDTAVAVNQGGKRKGAVCAYLETWHLDIEEFIELRKNTGDDRRRTHDMNTANWMPDLFMKRVFDRWRLDVVLPERCARPARPVRHSVRGSATSTTSVWRAVANIRLFKTVKAQNLWRKMLGMLFETGHPWITFKDACNLRSPQQHVGVVHSSNLCTEITLNTSKDEIAVCNLGSVNLVQPHEERPVWTAKLERTVKTAVRMLDNVIDINYYSVPNRPSNSNLRHRPVGLGIMGFQDALYKARIPTAPMPPWNLPTPPWKPSATTPSWPPANWHRARRYSTFEGSLWSQGICRWIRCKPVIEARGEQVHRSRPEQTLDWDAAAPK
jgi:ribonucleoside-diphosphate reductase alpha chain